MPAEEKKPLSQPRSLSVALRPAPVEEQKTLKPLSLLDYCKGEDETMHDWLELFAINDLVEIIFEYSNPAGKLLTAVAHAAPDEKENPDSTKTEAEQFVKQAPSLLAHKGYVEDLACTSSKGYLTAFHLAVLLGDWHMYNMMLKYMDKTTAKAQLEELLTKGVEYTDAKGEQQKEQLFSLQPLLNAYAHLMQVILEGKVDLVDKIWVEEIGAAQAVVPPCVAQKFCHPTSHFGEGMDVTINEWSRTEGSFWYSAAGLRACAIAALGAGRVSFHGGVEADRQSVQSLSDKRTEQLNTLTALLGVTMPQESSSSPRPK